MKALYFAKQQFPAELLRPTVDFILQLQQGDGAIPWFSDHKTDPWNHTEAAMGLAVGGEHTAAARAYQWLAQQQLDDGSWWADYRDNQAASRDKRETNFIAYVATGVWHYYLVTGEREFLQQHYAMVTRAIDFVLRYQADSGEIFWAVNPDGSPRDDALVTACSSIYKSLECALNIAATLGHRQPQWQRARLQLQQALRHKPERFDRSWESKARYSMDWFYPVLAGVFERRDALQRIDARWHEFVEHELGCRCVSDEPWVTVAESCELTMALLAIGDRARAQRVYSWLHQFKDSDGGYWTGYVFPDRALWPEEKTSWTAGAILLAADALTGHTGAAGLFTGEIDDGARTDSAATAQDCAQAGHDK
ncbi:MAG: prenyltransferase [Pseudomonadales bacterium]|nr:prenyltransferase [Gammaproteobacteria bacterium]NNL56980.1 prenyltransferase [Pseudomonadales bacterium]